MSDDPIDLGLENEEDVELKTFVDEDFFVEAKQVFNTPPREDDVKVVEKQPPTPLQKKTEEAEIKEPEVNKEPEISEPEDKTQPPAEESEEELPETPEQFLYQFMVEKGIHPGDEEFDGSYEKLQEILDTLPEEMFYRSLSEINPQAHSLLEYVYELGPNATVENVANFFQQFAEPSLPDIDVEQEPVAEQYLRDYYRRAGTFRSDKDLDAMVEMLKESGEVVEYAKEFYSKEKEQLDQLKQERIEQAKAEKERMRQAARKRQQALMSELDKMEWGDELKGRVSQILSPEVHRKYNEAIRSSPKAILQMARFYSTFDEQTGAFDLDKLVDQKAEQKATRKVKSILDKDRFRTSLEKISGSSRVPKSKGDNNKRTIIPRAIGE